jgi:hypothetical protein
MTTATVTSRLLVWLAVAAVWTMGVVVFIVTLWRCH